MVTRYTHVTGLINEAQAHYYIEDANGEWVKANDVAALEQQVEAWLASTLEALHFIASIYDNRDFSLPDDTYVGEATALEACIAKAKAALARARERS